jgi:hypothetical protein
MSALRDAAQRIATMGRLPAGKADRQLDSEKAAARLKGRETRSLVDKEPWDAFLHRIGVIDV